MITLDDVHVDTRLAAVTLAMNRGSLIVVVGENGAGKSTLLDVVAGVLAPTCGSVALDGSLVASLTPRDRARRIASIGASDAGVDDVVAAARIAQGLAPRRGSDALIDSTTSGLVARVAEELDVAHLLARPLAELSSGERRRVHVARALVDDAAEVFVLDEPHTAVDVKHQAHVSAALQRRARAGKLVVVSAHDLGVASSIADRVVGLREGRVVVDCPSAELLEPEVLERLYGIARLQVMTIGR